MQKDRSLLLALFLLLLLAGFTKSLRAQPKMDPADRLKLTDHLLNCEEQLFIQDAILADISDPGIGTVIIIIRPGSSEISRKLQQNRLQNVKTYFATRGARMPPERLVYAIGGVKGTNAEIEFYVQGKLYQRLIYPLNRYICHSCCGPDPDYFPYRKTRKAASR